MCGIFGVFTDLKNGFSNKQVDILGQNIIVNQFRGTDSTGLFQVDNKKDSSILKVLGGAYYLFTNPNWEDFQKHILHHGQIVVGHGRAATRGNVKIENAHPFAKTFATGERLKLVHNGTLEAYQDLPDFHKFDVDSEWIAEMLVREGVKALSKIRGAMALVWFDEKEGTINFFRNNDRPLHFGKFKGTYENTFILNSEAAAVRYLASRNGLTSMLKEDAYYFPAYTHVSLSISDPLGEWTRFDKIEPPAAKTYYNDYYPAVVTRPGRRSVDLFGVEDEDDVDNFEVRSYQLDLDRLRSNKLKSVRFIEREGKHFRETTFPDGSIMTDNTYIQYLPDLIAMERMWTKGYAEKENWYVRMTYNFNGKETFSYVGCLATFEDPPPRTADVKGAAKAADIIAPELPDDWKDPAYYKQFVDVQCKKFSPGRKIRWHSKNGSQLINHSARFAPCGGCDLAEYKNTHDGEFNIDDDIIMEVADRVVQRDGDTDYVRFDGSRFNINGKVDRCVDIVAYLPLESPGARTLLNSSDVLYIKGKIASLALATKDWHEDTRAYVVATLDDDWRIIANHSLIKESKNETETA